MWTIIKDKLKAFLLDLLRDHLCGPDGQVIGVRAPADLPKEPDTSRPVTTYWRVTGTAEVTSEVFQTPNPGQRAKAFLEVDRTVMIPAGTAYEDFREYCIARAVEVEQQKLGNSGYLWGKWFDKPEVVFIRKDYAE